MVKGPRMDGGAISEEGNWWVARRPVANLLLESFIGN
jgi:hypothetical protein